MYVFPAFSGKMLLLETRRDKSSISVQTLFTARTRLTYGKEVLGSPAGSPAVISLAQLLFRFVEFLFVHVIST